MRGRWLTLTELVISMAMFAMLVAFLVPMLQQARQRALQTQCLDNLRRQITASLMYSLENDSVMPYAHDRQTRYAWNPTENWDSCESRCAMWTNLIWPHLRDTGVYECPAARPVGWGDPANKADPLCCNVYNEELAGPVAPIADPAGKTLIWETGRKTVHAQAKDWDDGPNQFPHNWDNWPAPMTGVHGQGRNHGFLDGHAAWVTDLTAHANRAKMADGPYDNARYGDEPHAGPGNGVHGVVQ